MPIYILKPHRRPAICVTHALDMLALPLRADKVILVAFPRPRFTDIAKRDTRDVNVIHVARHDGSSEKARSLTVVFVFLNGIPMCHIRAVVFATPPLYVT